jgi:hypothetical protein
VRRLMDVRTECLMLFASESSKIYQYQLQQRSYGATTYLQAPIMPEDAATRQVDEDDDARHRREEAERRAKRKVRL